MKDTTAIIKTIIDGSVASITSTNAPIVKICNADKVTLQFIRADHSAGSSAFTVEVSNDGTNWIAYNKLISNVTNTITENLTRVAGPTLSSNTSAVYALSPEDTFGWLRVYYTRTTDGTTSCAICIKQ